MGFDLSPRIISVMSCINYVFIIAEQQHDLPKWPGAEEGIHPQQFQCQVSYGLHV